LFYHTLIRFVLRIEWENSLAGHIENHFAERNPPQLSIFIEQPWNDWSTGEFDETVAGSGEPGRVSLSPPTGAVALQIAGATTTKNATSQRIRKFKIRVHN
jgi:hypothetical protein